VVGVKDSYGRILGFLDRNNNNNNNNNNKISGVKSLRVCEGCSTMQWLFIVIFIFEWCILLRIYLTDSL
jgi:hypothetical protein